MSREYRPWLQGEVTEQDGRSTQPGDDTDARAGGKSGKMNEDAFSQYIGRSVADEERLKFRKVR